MNIRELEYFSRLCDKMKISTAADSLFITQQGLSKAIKKLESELQVPLFRRTPFGVKLTEFGELIIGHVNAILLDYNCMLNKINDARNRQDKRTIITLELGIMAIIGISPFRKFQELYPNIELILQEHTEATCTRAIMEEESDLGFAISPINNEMFDYIPFFQVNGVILVNKNHPLAQKSEIALEDLRNQNLVFSGSASWYAYVRACRRAGFEPKIVLSSIEQHSSDAYTLVQDNLGICPNFHGFTNIEHYRNILELPLQESLQWEICIVYKKNKSLSRASKVFVDHFMEFVSQHSIGG